MKTLKLIYIGDNFYFESNTFMSPVYTESGERSDWGKIQIALEKGEKVEIRQASSAEKKYYQNLLNKIKEGR